MLLVYTAAAKQVQVMTLIAKTDERKLPLKPLWLAYVSAFRPAWTVSGDRPFFSLPLIFHLRPSRKPCESIKCHLKGGFLNRDSLLVEEWNLSNDGVYCVESYRSSMKSIANVTRAFYMFETVCHAESICNRVTLFGV